MDGLPEAEATDLLDRRFAHVIRPEFVYRHRWRAGDLLCWDNYATKHIAMHDHAIPSNDSRGARRCSAMFPTDHRRRIAAPTQAFPARFANPLKHTRTLRIADESHRRSTSVTSGINAAIRSILDIRRKNELAFSHGSKRTVNFLNGDRSIQTGSRDSIAGPLSRFSHL